MSFVRPEAQAALWRWREVLAGAGLLALGVYWFGWPGGLLFWLSFPVLAIGALLIALGIPRARFRGPGGGPGVVQITEGRISYFGPLTGGIVDLAEIDMLEFDASGHPGHWVIDAPGQPLLHIPVTAAGAEALFDAFLTLPGLGPARLSAAVQAETGRHLVWSRARPAVH